MDQLPNEVLILILEQAEESWARRAAVSTVCQRWRMLMCTHPWREKLVIAQDHHTLWAPLPFTNLTHIRIERPTLALLTTLRDHFLHLTTLEFGCAIRNRPLQWEAMCQILQQMAVPNMRLGSLVAWLQEPEMVCVENCVQVDMTGCSTLEDDAVVHLTQCEVLNVSLHPFHGVDHLTDRGLHYLTSLHTLDISGRRNISDQGLRSLTRLRSLSINRCRIAGSCLLSMPKLTALSYQRCCSLDTNALAQIPNLTYLDMSRSPVVSNELLRCCSNLRVAHLEHCPSISGIGLQYLQVIQQLYLDGCTQLIDNSLRGVSLSLRLLSVVGCKKLTCKIFPMLSHVQCLDVRKCGLITKSEIRLAQKLNPHTTICSDFDYKFSMSSLVKDESEQ